LLCLRDRRHFAAFVPLAVAGHVSLFPLLFTEQEFPIKTVYTVFWLVAVLVGFDKIAPPYVLHPSLSLSLLTFFFFDFTDIKRVVLSRSSHPRVFLLDRFSLLYTAIAIPLIVYTSVVHGLLFKNKYEFVPLMFTSSYCALGVVGSWVGFQVVFFTP
jgi:alpha-1,3-glucosyltransferase